MNGAMAKIGLVAGLVILIPILVCGLLHIEIPIPLPARWRRFAKSNVARQLLGFLLTLAIVVLAMILIDIGSRPERETPRPRGDGGVGMSGEFSGVRARQEP